MRVITIKQILRWLGKQPARRRFPYYNAFDGCGCLYTQCARALLKKRVECCAGGRVRQLFDRSVVALMPSHDTFWKTVGTFNPVSKSKAIKALTTLAKEEA